MKKRNSNGMGSIRQRSDGRWEARYSTPDGRQRSVYGRTEAEASKKLRTQLHAIDMEQWREPSRMTVEEWLAIWMRDYQGHTTRQTRRTYEIILRSAIAPVIGELKLSALLPLHVRRVITTMIDRELSASYISIAKAIMHAAFKAAIESGIIKTNPADGIKTPRKQAKKYTIVDREQIPAFIAAANDTTYGLAVIFLLLTGLRCGEQRALKWQDVDLDAGEIYVRHQLMLIDHKPTFTPPKDGAARQIHITPEAVSILRQQKKVLAEHRIAAGPSWQTGPVLDDLVFRTSSGGYLNHRAIYDAVHLVGQRIGLPDLHPHDLRHSYAVAALRSGVDVKTVQHNLGHKTASMTLDTYAAYTTDAGKVGAEKLSEYLQNALKK